MMNTMKILIVEDDMILAQEIKNFLQKWGYSPVCATHFDNLIDDFTNYRPHLILMDINLPYYDGFYWCTKIREQSTLPIIYISSRNDDKDKIMAIAQGGDDFIEKPFHLDLLKAKIETLLRRTYQYKAQHKVYLDNDLYFEATTSSIYYKQERLKLTKSENVVLSVLVDHRPSIVSRDILMDTLWNTNEFISDNTLNVLTSRLRSKLKDFCHDEIIHTKKGQGYYLS